MKKHIKEKKHIVYEGKVLTIEWFFDARGKSEAKEYFDDLTVDAQLKAMRLFQLIANVGKIFNEEKFRHEGDQIYAFKPSPNRFLCFFFDGSKIVITNAFRKSSKKLPVGEKDRSLRLRDDYIKRNKTGDYYG